MEGRVRKGSPLFFSHSNALPLTTRRSMPTLSDWTSFPREPGVYVMADVHGKVLYVGKAKDLRSRLHSYAVPGGDDRPQIPHLLSKVADVRCIVTATEKDALLLENTLIKKHRPPFNVFLRDDKEYLLLRIDGNEEFPRFDLVRKVARDGASYFGPFSSARGIRETLRVVHRLFPLCTCTRRKFAGRSRPCINFQMGRCLGACAGKTTREAYLPLVEQALRFLKGEYRELVVRWKKEMSALAAEMRFEEAAKVRDRIEAIATTLARQRVIRAVHGDVDAVGWHVDGDRVTTAILHVRAGRLSDARSFHFRVVGDVREALASFLSQHYGEGAFLPDEILLPFDVVAPEPLLAVLADRKGAVVRLTVPKAGERGKLVALAAKNAVEADRMRREKEASYEAVALRLSSICGLSKPPVRIDGFDVSNTGGEESVGSMVAFVGGKPAKSLYRTFAIRGIDGPDDFASMEQVVRRRFGHGDDFGGFPDLVLVDGGRGQLAKAVVAMAEAGAGHIPVVSLAKERVRGGESVFQERIFLPGRKNPVVPTSDDKALHLLMRVRDEAHRFALAFHRKKRAKRFFT